MALTFARRGQAAVRVDGAGTDENLPNVSAWGSTSEWAASGHILGVGELGLDTTTGELRHGNGSSTWSSLSNVLSSTYVLQNGSAKTSQRYPMRRLAWAAAQQAAGTTTLVKWLTMGTSVSDFIIREVGPNLVNAFGGRQAGAILGSWSLSTGSPATSSYKITTNSTTGTAPVTRTADWDAWPSGLTSAFTTTGSATYGIGGGAALCDNIEIYYVTGPASSTDGGTFSYQVDSGSVVNVDTSAGAAGIARVSLTPTRGNHTLTLAWVSGNVRIIGVAFWDATLPGFLPINISQGGVNVYQATAQAFANLTTFLGWVAPDVITWQSKGGQIEPSIGTPPYSVTFIRSWLQAIANYATDDAGPDVIIIGGAGDAAGTDQVGVNDACATVAAEFQDSLNAFVWDGYRPLVDYDHMLAMGWHGDGTHPGWQAEQFLAGRLAADLGLLELPALPSTRDVVANNVTARTAVYVGDQQAPVAKIRNDGTDARIVITNRALVLRDSTDANTVAQFIGAGGLDNIIPRYTRVGGTTYPYLVGVDGNSIGSGNNGSLTQPRDFRGRTLQMVPVAASVSGAVALDLSAGCLRQLTLTGNVTALTFTNALSDQLVEIHFIQDGTGSRTLAGAVGFKWAGAAAPTLSTTAGRVDIFTFRVRASSLWEISRSMNVG